MIPSYHRLALYRTAGMFGRFDEFSMIHQTMVIQILATIITIRQMLLPTIKFEIAVVHGPFLTNFRTLLSKN